MPGSKTPLHGAETVAKRDRAVVVAAAAAIVVLLLAAGCGSSKKTSTTTTTTTAAATDTWATGVCTAITTWKKSLTTAVDSVKNAPSKASVTSAANDVSSATDTLAADLKGLGRPDTPAGQKAQDALSQLSTSLSKDVQTIKTKVQGASGLTGLLAAVPAVTKTLTAMGTDVTSTMSEIENLDARGELKDAFQKSPACSSLTG
jgi:hypothetical protein